MVVEVLLLNFLRNNFLLNLNLMYLNCYYYYYSDDKDLLNYHLFYMFDYLLAVVAVVVNVNIVVMAKRDTVLSEVDRWWG